MDLHKSKGPDGIQPRILKELQMSLQSPSWVSWEFGEVPVDWKLVNIVPIFKEGKKEDPGNCRLGCLTPVPIKLMENIILEGIEKHWEDNAGIGHSQHGFMRGKSWLSNKFPSMTE